MRTILGVFMALMGTIEFGFVLIVLTGNVGVFFVLAGGGSLVLFIWGVGTVATSRRVRRDFPPPRPDLAETSWVEALRGS